MKSISTRNWSKSKVEKSTQPMTKNSSVAQAAPIKMKLAQKEMINKILLVYCLLNPGNWLATGKIWKYSRAPDTIDEDV